MTDTWPITNADRADPVEVAIAQRFADDGTLNRGEQMSCYMIVGRTHQFGGNGDVTECVAWAACEGMDPTEQIKLLEETAATLRSRLHPSN